MEAGTNAARVAVMVERNAAALLRVAQRYSLCGDDADDALQRGLTSPCDGWTASTPRRRSRG